MADSRLYKLEDKMDIETIGIGLENYLKQIKNLYTEGLRTAEGYLVQAKQEEKNDGMDSVIQVQLYKSETMVTVNIGSGKWVDKADADIAEMVHFAPLAVTAAFGAWSQKEILEEIFDFIDQFILTGGRDISVSMSSSRGLNADQVICLNCKTVNQMGTKFCISCDSSLASGVALSLCKPGFDSDFIDTHKK